MKAVMAMDTLQGCLKALTAINVEGKMKLSPSGCKVSMIDPANVAMVNLEIPDRAFDFYDMPGEAEIALEFGRLHDILLGTDPVTLCIENNQLKVRTGRHKFDLRLLALSAIKNPPHIPDIDLPAAVEMDAVEWKDALKAALRILVKNECIIVEQNDEKFSILAATEMENYVSEWKIGELSGIKMGMGRALFTLNYMLDIAGAMSGQIRIETGIDYPMKISGHIGEATVSYIVAPRVETND